MSEIEVKTVTVQGKVILTVVVKRRDENIHFCFVEILPFMKKVEIFYWNKILWLIS